MASADDREEEKSSKSSKFVRPLRRESVLSLTEGGGGKLFGRDTLWPGNKRQMRLRESPFVGRLS